MGRAVTPLTIVHLVPHTHWDREWYLPFQAFRARLVGLVDGLLDEMEADPRLRFTLDGQTATIDDYLEIRPDAGERLAHLIRDGRLAVGPWAILMDEFLVSGETIVRNLELGIERATELGRVMEIGYLPDMFGHVAQMPQMLARAGITDAVVWRGVPATIDSHLFTWRSPDGSGSGASTCTGATTRPPICSISRTGSTASSTSTCPPCARGSARMRSWPCTARTTRSRYRATRTSSTVSMLDKNRYHVRVETLAEYIAGARNGRTRPRLGRVSFGPVHVPTS